MVDYKVS